MSAPVTSTPSLPLVSFTQDDNYLKTEGFKQFKAIYNQKNTQCTRNDPRGSYQMVLEVYTTVKSSGMSEWDMAALSLQDFITSSVEFWCLKVVNPMSYLTVGSLENTSRLVDVSLNWTINSTG